MLKVEHIQVKYGGITAIQDVSFEIQKGQIVTLIGSNGAGKSTTLKSISGLVKTAGKITFKGEDITNRAPEDLVSKGLIHVPEGRRIFTELTVKENLMMGAYLRKDQSEIQSDLAFIYELFPRLKERHKQSGGTLSGGEQQMLAIGRGIMSKPELLMLDEPSMGLAPIIIEEIFQTIQTLNQNRKLTVLLVEQNAGLALSISEKAYVLESGSVLFSGAAPDLASDERVRKAYLGE